jgi:hypothetical protein
MVNIGFSLSGVLTVYYGRVLKQLLDEHDPSRHPALLVKYISKTFFWTGVCCLVGCTSAMTVGMIFKFPTVYALPPIFLLIWFSYVADACRICFQAKSNFSFHGLFTLFWMLLRFCAGISALMLTSKVWVAIFCMAVATAIPIIFFYTRYKWCIQNLAPQTDCQLPSLWQIKHLALSLFALTLFINLDMIVAYLFFEKNDFALYVNSTFIPKSLLLYIGQYSNSVFLLIKQTKAGGIQVFKSVGLMVSIASFSVLISLIVQTIAHQFHTFSYALNIIGSLSLYPMVYLRHFVLKKYATNIHESCVYFVLYGSALLIALAFISIEPLNVIISHGVLGVLLCLTMRLTKVSQSSFTRIDT